MEFFRRASKTASDITPPIVVIEELRNEIADLKDELESATQAKKFATETLKAQIETNSMIEHELDQVRAELHEVLARQQAEVPVMAAPSPNGSNRIRLDLADGNVQFVSIGEGEGVIKQLSERVVMLERDLMSQSDRYRQEVESLKRINRENVNKMRDLLSRKDDSEKDNEIAKLKARIDEIESLITSLETERDERIRKLETDLEISHQMASQVSGFELELSARNERILELERMLIEKGDEMVKMNETSHEVNEEMDRTNAENDVLRLKISEFENELTETRKKLQETVNEKEKISGSNSGLVSAISKLERDIGEKSILIDTLRNDLAIASESSTDDSDKLRDSLGECEEQILDLINQVATLRNENNSLKQTTDETVRELVQTRKDADEAAKRVEMVTEKISHASEALNTAVQSALVAKKEVMFWKRKYTNDVKAITERMTKLTTDETGLL
jgi:chromosome segregation ATPase